MVDNSSIMDIYDNSSMSDIMMEHARMEKIVRLVVPIVFCLMMVIGVMGNGILIYIVLANKCMKNVPNILIVTLSIGDLMMLIVSVPFVAVLFTVNEYPFNNLVCKTNQYLQTFSMAVSIFTLTTLSGNRYVAVAYPLSKHKGKSTLKIVITVIVIWILSALLAIPDSVSFHTDAIPTAHNASIQTCRDYPPDWESWYPKAHSMFRFITLFVIPLIIIGIFYCLMALKSTRQLPVESTINSAMTQQQQRQIEARVKAAKVVLMFVVLFVICWLPRHIYLIWFHWADDAHFNFFWYIFKIVSYCLTFMYACVNPYALYLLSSHFRKHYNSCLFRCCPMSRIRFPLESNPSFTCNSTTRK